MTDDHLRTVITLLVVLILILMQCLPIFYICGVLISAFKAPAFPWNYLLVVILICSQIKTK